MIPGLISLFYRSSSSGGMVATVTPTLINSYGHGTVTSAAFTANPSGGTPPYSYVWTRGGSTEVIIDAPTSQSSTAHATVGNADYIIASAQCKVTDSAAHSVTTNSCLLTFQYQP